MGKDFLFEVGVEEIPHSYLTDIHSQFERIFRDFFSEHSLSYSNLRVFSTPRRLAVLVEGLQEKQEDRRVIKKGPPKSVAYEQNGQPSQALKGFLSSVSSLQGEVKVLKEGDKEFVFFEGIQKGEETREILRRELPELLRKLVFPKTMKWSDIGYYFVRPIRWVVCMFGGEVIPIEVARVVASNVSKGHRLIGDDVEIKCPGEYEELLEGKGKVIPSPEKRKKMILEKIEKVEDEMGCEALLSEKLLEEITNLVEYPGCVVGAFDPSFLDMPSEIIISEMVDHQKFVPLVREGKLLNKFVIITNTLPNDKIRKGNEKVISARLNDGKFLYEEDLRRSIEFFVDRTKELVFFGGLGTVYDKMVRMGKLSEILCDVLGVREVKADVVRAASICKFDLTTGVVYEFPELQGVMGYYYSLAFGESENVAVFIKEHYKPVSADDDLPSTLGGCIVSIADKLDNVFSLYSAGKRVSGSSDPYGLRRQIIGVSRICLKNSLDLEIAKIFEISSDLYSRFLVGEVEEVGEEIAQFVSSRLRGFFKDMGFRTDEVESTVRKTTNPYDAYLRVKAISNFRNRGEFEKVAVLFKRVRNILVDAGFSSPREINTSMLTESERMLLELILSRKSSVLNWIRSKEYDKVLLTLLEFGDPVHRFFEKVFVMDENREVRENRLSILYSLYEMFDEFIDFNVMEFA